MGFKYNIGDRVMVRGVHCNIDDTIIVHREHIPPGTVFSSAVTCKSGWYDQGLNYYEVEGVGYLVVESIIYPYQEGTDWQTMIAGIAQIKPKRAVT